MVRVSAAQLAKMRDRSDWERVVRQSDADIERAIAGDPDAAPILDEAFWRNARLLEPPPGKTPVTLRVDDDVLDFFRSGGPGYQSRMNAVLRAYAHARRRGEAGNAKRGARTFAPPPP
ncbi:MAG: BrnA antitoxin family protein, partial [Gemmatimonadaceae bacterium]|nr:BrnA antitoxin family protein [Gemmatimonadaceae bacterium]